MATNEEQLEKNIDTEQAKQYQEETLYIEKKQVKCVCICMQVCVHIICPLNPSKEKEHDFEQAAYIFSESKGPTHILKSKKKNFVFRSTTIE